MEARHADGTVARKLDGRGGHTVDVVDPVDVMEAVNVMAAVDGEEHLSCFRQASHF